MHYRNTHNNTHKARIHNVKFVTVHAMKKYGTVEEAWLHSFSTSTFDGRSPCRNASSYKVKVVSVHVIKEYRAVEMYLQAFVTAALHGREW